MMKSILSYALFSIFVSAMLSACGETKSEVSGTVIDVSTNKPVEGAYVMAVYNESGGTLFGHSGHWCVRTKGMYTGSDGVFRFPSDKPNDPQILAIKPDYVRTVDYKDIQRPVKMERVWSGERTVRDPNIYLKPQDPAKPTLTDRHSCERPKTRNDVIANIEFEKIYMVEKSKYFPENYRLNKEGFVRQISMWESLP